MGADFKSNTPRFRRWVASDLIPCLPGGHDRWAAFASGAYVVDNDAWILRGLILQPTPVGATVWAYVDPLFDDQVPLSHNPSLMYCLKLGFARLGEDGEGTGLASNIAAIWSERDGELHLDQCRDPAGLLHYIHRMYANGAATELTCAAVEAACLVLLGDVDAAKRVVSTRSPDPTQSLPSEPQLLRLRKLISSGPKAAREGLEEIRQQQLSRHQRTVG